MSAVELLLWVCTVWSVFFLYALADAPTLVIRWMGKGSHQADATPTTGRCPTCRRAFEDCTCVGGA